MCISEHVQSLKMLRYEYIINFDHYCAHFKGFKLAVAKKLTKLEKLVNGFFVFLTIFGMLPIYWLGKWVEEMLGAYAN